MPWTVRNWRQQS